MSNRRFVHAAALVLSLLALAATATADARKPSTAEARKLATQWLTAFSDGDGAQAVPLTATTFRYGSTDVVGSDPDQSCATTTATDAAGITAALECIEDRATPGSRLKLTAFGKKSWKEWDRWTFSKPYVKALRELAKTSTLLEMDSGCDAGNIDVLAIAVGRDATGAARVTGYFYLRDMCGE